MIQINKQANKQTNKQTKLINIRLSLIISGTILLRTLYLLHVTLMNSNASIFF